MHGRQSTETGLASPELLMRLDSYIQKKMQKVCFLLSKSTQNYIDNFLLASVKLDDSSKIFQPTNHILMTIYSEGYPITNIKFHK